MSLPPLPILRQSDRWVVVAKPPALACHRSALCRDRVTLARWARMWFDRKVHLVHRLDRAASGCLVIAFDAETTAALQAALTAPEATKQYLAFTRGYWWDDPVHVQSP